MNVGKTLFAQIMEFIPWTSFGRIVNRYGGNAGVRRMTCAEQFRVMAFAQLTWRESLRDIEVTLGANAGKLYAMGLRHAIHRSTLVDANELRDWRIWSDLAALLIRRAQTLLRRQPGSGSGQHGLCARFDDDRSLPEPVRLGTVPNDQGRDQVAHAAGLARCDPRLHPYQRRQDGRRHGAGHTGHRGWRLLHHGSRLLGLLAAVQDASGRRLFRNARQEQYDRQARILGRVGSEHRGDLRSNHRAEGFLPHQALSRAFAAHTVQGPRDGARR